MPLQYIIPVSITIVGDGTSHYLAVDLAKDYVIMGESLKHGWLTSKLPTSISTDGTSPLGYEAALKKGTSVIFISFPTAPHKGARIPINIHLHFDGEDRDEPKPSESKGDINEGKQDISGAEIAGQ